MPIVLGSFYLDLEKQVPHLVRWWYLLTCSTLPPAPTEVNIWAIGLNSRVHNWQKLLKFSHKECPWNNIFALWTWSQILFSSLILTISLNIGGIYSLNFTIYYFRKCIYHLNGCYNFLQEAYKLTHSFINIKNYLFLKLLKEQPISTVIQSQNTGLTPQSEEESFLSQ